MRKSQEISKAIAILRKKGDKLSLNQADVLANRRGEVWVFERYVRDVADAERDESVYCAARDAAKYLIGRIEMAELIPDIEKYQKIAAPSPEPKVSTESLLRRIEKLERLVDDLLLERRQRSAYKKMPESYDRGDFLIQTKAYEYIGCSKTTLKSWTDKGLITGYRKGTKVYYCKSELDASPVVLNFKNIGNGIR